MGRATSVLLLSLLGTSTNTAGATRSRITQLPGGVTRPLGLSVMWYAPFFSGGGYCSEAITFVQAMAEHNITVKIEQHGDGMKYPFLEGLDGKIKHMLGRASAVRASPESSIVVCHSEPGAWHPPKYQTSRCPPRGALYTVGRTMFETDRLPSGWEERLNGMDEVWVPTAFHRDVFIAGGVRPEAVQVLGEPVDVAFFDPSRKSLEPLPLPKRTKDTFAFLSVFKWEDRKAPEVLLSSYFTEFRREIDDVLLVILTAAYHDTSNFESKVAGVATSLFPHRAYPHDLPPVHVLSGLSQHDLVRLYAACDALVLPSRGEGWGRPHVEAMAMQLPVIATNWSGPTEFMTQENSYPLRYDGLTEIKTGAFQGHMWAEPSQPHLQQLMRHVTTHRQEAHAKGFKARESMVERFSPREMGMRVVEHIVRIEHEVLRRRRESQGRADEL